MILHGIKDNIPITHPSYYCVYQDKAKQWELYKEINTVLGWNQTKKTDKTVVHVSTSTLVIFSKN